MPSMHCLFNMGGHFDDNKTAEIVYIANCVRSYQRMTGLHLISAGMLKMDLAARLGMTFPLMV